MEPPWSLSALSLVIRPTVAPPCLNKGNLLLLKSSFLFFLFGPNYTLHAGIRQLKETHKTVLKYDGKQQLNFSIKIKSEMLKVMENWRAPDSAQGSSGYSVQALCCHAEMQTNEARSFSRKIKNPECMQNKQIFKFSNWLNFLNTVWINRKQINQTETEPFCLFVSMDYGLWIGDLWMNCPCKLMGRSWESTSTSLLSSVGLSYLRGKRGK